MMMAIGKLFSELPTAPIEASASKNEQDTPHQAYGIPGAPSEKSKGGV